MSSSQVLTGLATGSFLADTFLIQQWLSEEIINKNYVFTMIIRVNTGQAFTHLPAHTTKYQHNTIHYGAQVFYLLSLLDEQSFN